MLQKNPNEFFSQLDAELQSSRWCGTGQKQVHKQVQEQAREPTDKLTHL